MRFFGWHLVRGDVFDFRMKLAYEVEIAKLKGRERKLAERVAWLEGLACKEPVKS